MDARGLVALLAIVMSEATERFFLGSAGVGLLFSGIVFTGSFFLDRYSLLISFFEGRESGRFSIVVETQCAWCLRGMWPFADG